MLILEAFQDALHEVRDASHVAEVSQIMEPCYGGELQDKDGSLRFSHSPIRSCLRGT